MRSQIPNASFGPKTQPFAASRSISTGSYAPDADGLPSTMTRPDGSTVGYSWTGRGQLDQIFGDGPPPLADYTCDAAGQLLQVHNQSAADILGIFAYAYDAAGQRTSLTR